MNDSRFLTEEFLAWQRGVEAKRFKEFLDYLDGPAIVATHVPPIDALVKNGKWAGSNLNGSFYSKTLHNIMAEHPNGHHVRLWTFGHTHERYDAVHDGVRYVCAPLGHRHEAVEGPGWAMVEV